MIASAMIERAEFPVHRNNTLKCSGIAIFSVAAGWPAAGLLRLHGAYESAYELAVHLRRNCININVLACKKFTGVFDVVYPRRFEIDLFESSRRQFAAIVVLFQCPRNAADPQQHILPNLREHLAACDNIGHREASSRLQDSEGFTHN